MGRVILALALAVGAAAGQTVPSAGPLPPVPAEIPLIPTVDSGTTATPEERLLLGIQERIAVIDRRVCEILQEHQGVLPAVRVHFQEELREERLSRDAAWQRLTATLEMQRSLPSAHAEDALDQPAAAPPAQEDPLQWELRASNHLSVALCHRDLLIESGATASSAKLKTGLEALNAAVTDLDHLPPDEQPLLRRLRVWYAVEMAKAAAEKDRADAFIEEAESRLAELCERHADSVLLIEQARQDLASYRLERRVQESAGGAQERGSP